MSDPNQVVLREFYKQAVGAHAKGFLAGAKAGGAAGFAFGVLVMFMLTTIFRAIFG